MKKNCSLRARRKKSKGARLIAHSLSHLLRTNATRSSSRASISRSRMQVVFFSKYTGAICYAYARSQAFSRAAVMLLVNSALPFHSCLRYRRSLFRDLPVWEKCLRTRKRSFKFINGNAGRRIGWEKVEPRDRWAGKKKLSFESKYQKSTNFWGKKIIFMLKSFRGIEISFERQISRISNVVSQQPSLPTFFDRQSHVGIVKSQGILSGRSLKLYAVFKCLGVRNFRWGFVNEWRTSVKNYLFEWERDWFEKLKIVEWELEKKKGSGMTCDENDLPKVSQTVYRILYTPKMVWKNHLG